MAEPTLEQSKSSSLKNSQLFVNFGDSKKQLNQVSPKIIQSARMFPGDHLERVTPNKIEDIMSESNSEDNSNMNIHENHD